MQTTLTTVTVRLEKDEEGGISTFSEELPGLVLYTKRPDRLRQGLETCIKALIEYDGPKVVSIRESEPPIPAQSAPRHERECLTYIVELAAA